MARIGINLKSGDVAKTNDTIIGIDLGTTNSLVAYIKDGQSKAVTDKEGKNTLVPSIVHFAESGAVIVGDEARKYLITHPERTIYSAKRLMGKSYKDVAEKNQFFSYKVIDDDSESLVKVRVGDTFYTPIELSSFILKDLKHRIEKELDSIVTKAVITVPAYFNDAQRQATRDAGKLAGLDVLRIVNEPTAASLAYGLGKEVEQTVAVYDLGGGTFDISILQIQDGVFEVLSTNGDTYLGGDDFDKAIMQFWMEAKGIEASQLERDKAFSQSLRLLAESAKKALSTSDSFEGRIGEESFTISKKAFEEAIQKLVEKTIESCKQALADAELTSAEIDNIVMVGGSTRVPYVQAAVAKYFGKALFNDLDPDEVVALGAAIQADVLAGNQKEILLLDVTPLSLGIETVGGLMDTIIPRNSKIPNKAGRQYTTSVDGQKNLKISVYQGERDLVEHNRKLGEFILRGIPSMAAGIPKIEIHFILNADGILKVSAKELRSNLEQTVEMKPSYGLSEEEMGKMLLESIQNAEADMKVRGLLEAKNEARNIILASEKFVVQNKEILSKEEIEQTIALTESLKKSVEGAEKDAINKAMDDLNTYTSPLAHRAMDATIAATIRGKQI